VTVETAQMAYNVQHIRMKLMDSEQQAANETALEGKQQQSTLHSTS
jgi:hypothetical protein